MISVSFIQGFIYGSSLISLFFACIFLYHGKKQIAIRCWFAFIVLNIMSFIFNLYPGFLVWNLSYSLWSLL